MDAILKCLKSALKVHLQFNVTQRVLEVFTTGYVQDLGHDAVFLGTYNDSGMSDGCACMSFSAMYQVELSGEVLDNKYFRKSLAQSEHFSLLQGKETPTK